MAIPTRIALQKQRINGSLGKTSLLRDKISWANQSDICIYEKFDSELESIWLNFEKVAEMTPFQSYCWLHHWQKNHWSAFR